ncbi:type I site-specific deoxyribonuclease [Spirosoma sp. KCTC 42546]|nr:type I site-specific deoxyribonuclease [Spirosoma sp. KCTC 42546]
MDEQRVVLEQLLQANGKLNALQTELNQQDELLKKLQQAILQDAIQGKLTARWREQHGPATETGTQLLACIQAAKAELVKQKKLKKEKPLPPITNAEKPFELPDGWVWCRLGEAGILDRGKSKHRPRNDERLFKNGSVPFIQTGDVAQSKKTGFLIKSYSTTYNEFGLAQSRLWPSGTLCITIAANIAETGFLTFDACFPDSVVGFTPLNDQATSSFVRYFIDVSKSYIERYAPATAQKNINLGILGELYFPLPPLTEQQAIVEAVEQAMEKLGQLRDELTHQRTQAGELLKALLHRAFQVEEANEVDVATPVEG